MTPGSAPDRGRRLSVGAVPLDGESLPGFVVRLSELARFDRADGLAGRCGLRQPGSAFDGADLVDLARMAGTDVERLEAIAYLPRPTRGRHAFLGGEVHRDFIDVTRRRWCPACLQNAPYHRASWDLVLATACPEHGIRLVDRCACGRQIGWTRPKLTECACGADLRSAATIPAAYEEVRAHCMLHRLLDASDSDRLPEGLRGCGSADLIWLAMCLGMFLTGWNGQRRIEKLVAKGPDEVASVVVAGAKALADWPSSLERFLEDQLSRSGTRKGVYGARKSLGRFYGWLAVLDNGPMKAAVAEAARAIVSGDPALARDVHRSPLLAPDGPRELVGLNEAIDIMEVSEWRVRRMLETGELPPAGSRGRGVPMLIERSAVEKLAARHRGELDRKATARTLGISKEKLGLLVAAGTLRPTRGDREREGFRWAFDPQHVAEFLDEISTVRGVRRRGVRVVGFAFAEESLRRRGTDLPEFIRLIREGGVPVIGLDRRAVGLRRLRFPAVAVRACRPDDPDGPLTLKATAERLGLKWEVVAHLARRGLIRVSDGAVLQTALLEFEENYVSGADLARRARVPPRTMAVRLARRGVLPITGSRLDGCRQNFYRRAEALGALEETV